MQPYHNNPRIITDRQLADLRAWLEELGDLSGIVHDINSGEIISGNQRSTVFDINKCEIEIIEEKEEPDIQGTIAIGFVIWNGWKYNYRRVVWTEEQCKKANIIANSAGGKWDMEELIEKFSKDDLLSWNFTPGDFPPLPALPKAPPAGEFPEFGEGIQTDHTCPKCGYRWSGKTE